MGSVRRNRGIGWMEIEFLMAEAKRTTTARENDRLHMQNAGVKLRSRIDIADGKNEMVNAVDLHGDLWR